MIDDMDRLYTTSAEACKAGKLESAKRAWDLAMRGACAVSVDCEINDDLQGMRAAEKVCEAISTARDLHLALLKNADDRPPPERQLSRARKRVVRPFGLSA